MDLTFFIWFIMLYLNATIVFAIVIVVIRIALRKAGVQILSVFLYRLREITAAMDSVGTIATRTIPESAEPGWAATPVEKSVMYCTASQMIGPPALSRMASR